MQAIHEAPPKRPVLQALKEDVPLLVFKQCRQHPTAGAHSPTDVGYRPCALHLGGLFRPCNYLSPFLSRRRILPELCLPLDSPCPLPVPTCCRRLCRRLPALFP